MVELRTFFFSTNERPGIWSCDLWANERPRKKSHGKGTYIYIQTYIYIHTSRLLDRIGPVGRFGENSVLNRARASVCCRGITVSDVVEKQCMVLWTNSVWCFGQTIYGAVEYQFMMFLNNIVWFCEQKVYLLVDKQCLMLLSILVWFCGETLSFVVGK